MPATRLLTLADSTALALLLCQNRRFLAPWQPSRDEHYFTDAGQHEVVSKTLQQHAEGNCLPLVIEDARGMVVGTITLQSIIRGALQSCSVGYWLAEDAQGQGLAAAALREAVDLAFGELRLHRVQAETLTHNVRSQRVLERLGFTRYGVAESYLRIAGEWQDNVLYQLLTPTPERTPPERFSSSSDSLDFRGVRDAYDTVAEDYATRLPDTRAEAPLDLAMVDAFADAVSRGGDARVLDAGCGAGRMSRYLAERGCLVEGVDLSPGMVAMARRDHRDLVFTVGSLTDLPYPDDEFAGVMLWYSIIHTPPAGQARIFAEATRVLRPGGHVLVGFQSGEGTRDVSEAYRRFGHEIQLERHCYTADHVAAQLEAAGLQEVCRLVRRARDAERDDQAFLLAKAD